MSPKTCGYCASRDGKIINSKDSEYEFIAPFTSTCRCLWMSVTTDDKIIPNRSWIETSSDIN